MDHRWHSPRQLSVSQKKSQESTNKPQADSNQTAGKYSFKKAVQKTYFEFCSESTIHGVQYLRSYRTRRERIFWIILILLALLYCVYMIWKQYLLWQSTPVILSISEKEYPVSQIPFPAITVCTETKYDKTNRIDFGQFVEHIQTFRNQKEPVKPPQGMTQNEYLKMRSLLQICGNRIVEDLNFEDYPPIAVCDHLKALAPSFNDSFLFCQFNQTRGSCKPFFERIYTEEGICYSFNALNASEIYRKDTFQHKYFMEDEHIRIRYKELDWNVSEGYFDHDDYDSYPERAIGSGLTAGFLFILTANEEDMDFTCRGQVQGFKVILHSPDDVPQVDKRFFLVPYEKDVLIIVSPHMTYTTENLKTLGSTRRNCYYPDERYLHLFKFYTQNNCEIECLANFTLQKCGCVHFSMPRREETRVCDAKDIKCYDSAEYAFLLSEYTEHGRDEKKCKCLPGCWMLDYSVELSYGVFNIRSMTESHENDAAFERLKVSRVKVLFRENEFAAWKRSEIFTFGEFIAHCGGLFGFIMGMTAINFVQIIYFWTVKLYQNFKNSKDFE